MKLGYEKGGGLCEEALSLKYVRLIEVQLLAIENDVIQQKGRGTFVAPSVPYCWFSIV